MKHLALLLIPCLIAFTCFPVERRSAGTRESVRKGRESSVPTKIHLTSGSVILAEKGFIVRMDTIICSGTRYGSSRSQFVDANWKVPLDSVAGVEYFQIGLDGARVSATLLLSASILADAAVGSVLLLVAIFGSCPTVYTLQENGEQLEAECFSYSIAAPFATNDLDRLSIRPDAGGTLRLRLKNEALETHYIDRFRLAYADHSEEIDLFPDDHGNLLAVGNLGSPIRARSPDRPDILSLIKAKDEQSYVSGFPALQRMLSTRQKDRVECVLVPPAGAKEVTVVLRARNTLQSTILLYDIMMRDQGLNVLDWQDRISRNMWYAYRVYDWYRQFAGIEISVESRGRVAQRERIFDTGPIAWKDIAARLSIGDDADTLTVRLEFPPDSWAIDYVGFSFETPPTPPLHYAPLEKTTNQAGDLVADINLRIEEADAEYLVTYPGESLDLTFSLPPPSASRRTVFVDSRGYYIEWVRPEWIRDRPDTREFDVADIEQHRKRLAQLWVEKKRAMEEQFFSTKIPTARRGDK